MIRVSTAVNDPIHVQVQVVELRQEGFICDDLIYLRVALAEPSVELHVQGAGKV